MTDEQIYQLRADLILEIEMGGDEALYIAMDVIWIIDELHLVREALSDMNTRRAVKVE